MKYKLRVRIYIVSLFLLAASFSYGQEKIRIVEERSTPFPNQPIEVVVRELNGKPFIDRNRVLGDRNWLAKLNLSVKNVSSKNIMSFNIDLLIKKGGGILMGIPIYFRTYTHATDYNALTPEGEKKLGVLRPGEVAKVKVNDEVMSKFARELAKYQVEDVERVTIDIRRVVFEDRSEWMYGHESQPDPSNPGKRIPTNQPRPMLSMRLADWLKQLIPSESSLSFSFFSPGWQPVFFASNAVRRASPPETTCVWFVPSELTTPTCSTFTTRHGCTDADTSCVFENFNSAVHSSDPGGASQKGFMNPEPYVCMNPDAPVGPSCSTCETYTQSVFRELPNCGSPGTCGQTAEWGCAPGFTDIGGFCQKSTEYQQSCRPPAGYDSATCTCPNGTCTTQCPEGYVLDPVECLCVFDGGGTPVVIDVLGNGFSLTDAPNGVNFDLNVDGIRERLGWTSAGTDDAWLVLDRNNNARIDEGSELFGNFTSQPEPPLGERRNGFLALAEYDKPEAGGNSDGVISRHDAIFDSLRLWRDSDHNGRSRNSELFRLSQLGLRKIHLDYQISRRFDEFGNQFRWRARVKDANDAQLGRWAWDVILVTE